MQARMAENNELIKNVVTSIILFGALGYCTMGAAYCFGPTSIPILGTIGGGIYGYFTHKPSTPVVVEPTFTPSESHLFQQRLDAISSISKQDIKIPDAFIDRIDLDVMDNPQVLFPCGHSYDKRNISSMNKCPTDKINIEKTTTNYGLKSCIEEFVEGEEKKFSSSNLNLFKNKKPDEKQSTPTSLPKNKFKLT